MARPQKPRKIENLPAPVIYIPAGWTKNQPHPVEVAIEDFEIMRLVDGHGYHIEAAAEKVGVSRSTAGRMLERVRRTVALGVERRAPLYLDASADLILEPSETVRGCHLEPLNHSKCLAVACSNESLETLVEGVFGRAARFLLIDQKNVVFEQIENPGLGVKRNAAKFAAELLKANGVCRVVAGRFGPDALRLLAENDIEAIVSGGFNLGQAIENFNTVKK